MIPAWQRINALFAKYNLPEPPTRLRDELVGYMLDAERAKEKQNAA